MRIYHYLFYKSYLLGRKSRNFDDVPILGGIVFVCLCLILNLSSIMLILIKFGIIDDIKLSKTHKYVLATVIVGLVYFYFAFRGKYKKIIKYYDEKERLRRRSPNAILIIGAYFIISCVIIFLCAKYNNG